MFARFGAIAAVAAALFVSPTAAPHANAAEAIWTGDFDGRYDCYLDQPCSWTYKLRVAGTYEGEPMAAEYQCSGESAVVDEFGNPTLGSMSCVRKSRPWGVSPQSFSGIGDGGNYLAEFIMYATVFDDHELRCAGATEGVTTSFRYGKVRGACTLMPPNALPPD